MSEFIPNDGVLTLSLEEQATGTLANNLTTTVEGYALDARQGKVLDDKKLDKSKVANNLRTIEEGWALDARQGKYIDENKVGFSDVVNNLTTKEINKVLSAYQGAVLKEELDSKVQTRNVSLSPSDWVSLTQTVNVSGVTNDNIVLVTPAPASYTEYHGCGVYCSAQNDGSLTFTAVTAPTVTLNVQIMLIM